MGDIRLVVILSAIGLILTTLTLATREAKCVPGRLVHTAAAPQNIPEILPGRHPSMFAICERRRAAIA